MTTGISVRQKKVSREWLVDHHVEQGMTLKEMGELLGVTRERVRQLLKREGIPNTKTNREPRRDPKNHYEFNEHFFDVIDTEEKAYWLGFAAAKARVVTAESGCKTVYLNIRETRMDHAERFKQIIGLTKDLVASVTSINEIAYTNYTLRIPSHYLSSVLEFYGIESPKYDNVSLPEIPEELVSHCFRGYFETKAFAWQKDTTKLLIAMGSYPIMKDFTSYMLSYDIKVSSLYKSSDHNYHRLNMGKVTGKAVLDILYKDATVYLPDRKEHFESIYGQL